MLAAPIEEADSTGSSPAVIATEENSNSSTGTTSCTRGYSDLNVTRYLLACGLLSAGRTALQQPINLALARKQGCTVAAAMSTTVILRRIVANEGGVVRGVTQGMLAMVAANGLSEAIYLGSMEYLREALVEEDEAEGGGVENDGESTSSSSSSWRSWLPRDMVSAYAGDALCRTVHIPLMVVAMRQMNANTLEAAAAGTLAPRKGIIATAKAAYGERGLRTLYAGFGTTLGIGCMWTGVWWELYQASKSGLYAAAGPYLLDNEALEGRSAFMTWMLSRDDNWVLNSIASVGTSGATAVVFNPFLVVRTRLQLARSESERTLLGVVRGIVRESGWRGLFAGTYLNVSACILDGYLGSTSYELAKYWADETTSS